MKCNLSQMIIGIYIYSFHEFAIEKPQKDSIKDSNEMGTL